MKKFEYINSLRGIAVLGVVAVHCLQYGNNNFPYHLQRFLEQGARGVQLFFLISAFTIFYSQKNRNLRENTPYKNFFIRRYFRIAPLYYLAISYFLIQNYHQVIFSGEYDLNFILNILYSISFAHDFSPYFMNKLVPGGWSIAVEMTFYLIVPLLLYKIKNLNQSIKLFIVATTLSGLLNMIFLQYPLIDDYETWKNYLFLYFPNQFPLFCLGIICYYIVIEKDNIISGLTLLGLFALFFSEFLWFWIPTPTLFGLSFGILLITLSKFPIKFIVNQITSKIGKVSYSIYLIHFAVLFWLNKFSLLDMIEVTDYFTSIINYTLRYLIVLTITIVISILTYLIIEQKFQRFGAKLIKE